MNRTGMGKAAFPLFISVSLILAFNCHALFLPRGPLFLLVHFTNPMNEITSAQATHLLRNCALTDNTGFTPHVYSDQRISSVVQQVFPALKSRNCRQVTTAPAHDRQAMYITDAAGIVPSMKVLAIDGIFPWGKRNADYSLTEDSPYPLEISGLAPFDGSMHVTVVQTGVTAMTRAFMRTVEKHGDLLRPIRAVEAITSRADLAMTSNEVSFVPGCTWPLKDRMLFCTPPAYMDILKKGGFDIIELTGNHNNDFGWKYNAETIAMLEKEGMTFFGGGKTLAEAMRIRYVQVKETRFSFVGFNQWGPPAAWATDTTAGALKLSRERFISLIKEARQNSDIVFVTVQWGNEDNPVPHDTQVDYFHLAADLDAHVMVSSSAHRAMGLEFYRERFISYGLGNFLFDQMQTINHRRGIIARHHFYRKRHIQTELIPYLIHNHSEPVPVHGRESSELFDYIYRYSLGSVFKTGSP